MANGADGKRDSKDPSPVEILHRGDGNKDKGAGEKHGQAKASTIGYGEPNKRGSQRSSTNSSSQPTRTEGGNDESSGNLVEKHNQKKSGKVNAANGRNAPRSSESGNCPEGPSDERVDQKKSEYVKENQRY